MRVIDLTPTHRRAYLTCLKPWNADEELIQHKARWHERMTTLGLRVKLSVDGTGVATGMIQVLPIEQSRAEGQDLTFIQCIWINGYHEGPGNVQGQGYGSALLQAAEDDARASGAVGMAAWGMDFPQWFPVSWYEHRGYRRVDRQGPEVLVWKPFSDGAVPPRWMRQRKRPIPVPGRVVVTAFVPGWCPSGADNARIARRAAAGLSDVVVQTVDTSDRDTFLEWGIDQGIWIDDEPFRPYGPPFGVEELRQTVQRKLTALEV